MTKASRRGNWGFKGHPLPSYSHTHLGAHACTPAHLRLRPPPQVLHHNYGPEADIWSCGVILYILLSGMPPFYGDTEKEIFRCVLKGTIDFDTEPWPGISPEAKDCVARMLDPVRPFLFFGKRKRLGVRGGRGHGGGPPVLRGVFVHGATRPGWAPAVLPCKARVLRLSARIATPFHLTEPQDPGACQRAAAAPLAAGKRRGLRQAAG